MRTLVLLGAIGAALTVSACASDYGPRHGYAAYYDDFYGPVYGGQWRDDGYYYYRSRADGDYVRDNDHHFRRDAGQGFHGYGDAGASVGVGASVGPAGVGVGGVGVRVP